MDRTHVILALLLGSFLWAECHSYLDDEPSKEIIEKSSRERRQARPLFPGFGNFVPLANHNRQTRQRPPFPGFGEFGPVSEANKDVFTPPEEVVATLPPPAAAAGPQTFHRAPKGCACPSSPQFDPVCGTDGNIYSNRAVLRCHNLCGASKAIVLHQGSCRPSG